MSQNQPTPPPEVQKSAREKLLEDFETFVDSKFPDFVSGAAAEVKDTLKKKLEAFKTALAKVKDASQEEIGKKKDDAIAEITQAVAGIIDAFGLDPKIADGLRILPEIIGDIKDIKNIKKGRHDITVNAGTLLAEIVSLISGMVLLLVMLLK